jgi:hypothetical protein
MAFSGPWSEVAMGKVGPLLFGSRALDDRQKGALSEGRQLTCRRAWSSWEAWTVWLHDRRTQSRAG